MNSVATLLLVVGYIGCFVAGVWVLAVAFRESFLWGLGCLFVPFVSLVFVATHWEDTKRPFLVWLGSLVPLILGEVLGSSSA